MKRIGGHTPEQLCSNEAGQSIYRAYINAAESDMGDVFAACVQVVGCILAATPNAELGVIAVTGLLANLIAVEQQTREAA